MSANLSDLMFELERYGIPKARVAEVVAEILMAGRRTLLASIGEIAGEHIISEAELELTVANLVALSNRRLDESRDASLGNATWFS